MFSILRSFIFALSLLSVLNVADIVFNRGVVIKDKRHYNARQRLSKLERKLNERVMRGAVYKRPAERITGNHNN